MPLTDSGLVIHGSDIDRGVQRTIDRLFSLIDENVRTIAEAADISSEWVRLLQPLHQCTFVSDSQVYVVVAVRDVGAVATMKFIDSSEWLLNLPGAVFMTERDLSFKSAFGIEFARPILDLDESRMETAAEEISRNYVAEEHRRMERSMSIVRLNPIFIGRDFMLNGGLVFALTPFGEPFDTIYRDHIRTSVERISGLTCVRADDIYGNSPIIEDIWKYTNEARIVVAELTGRNGNVFYETGVAHTVGKDVILITQSMDDVPFDLRHLRCIVYDYTPRGAQLLESNLQATIRNLLGRND